MSTLTISIQHFTEDLSHFNKAANDTKCIQIGKEEVKLSLFLDMIVHVKNAIESTKKLVELLSDFVKVV